MQIQRLLRPTHERQSQSVPDASFPDQPDITLTREQIDEIVEAMRDTKTFSQRLAVDPWNRSLFLVIAIVHFFVAIRFGWFAPPELLPFGGSFGPIASIGVSLAFMPMVWS